MPQPIRIGPSDGTDSASVITTRARARRNPRNRKIVMTAAASAAVTASISAMTSGPPASATRRCTAADSDADRPTTSTANNRARRPVMADATAGTSPLDSGSGKARIGVRSSMRST